MGVTNREAAKMIEAALASGATLTIPCPNGDKVTVGRSSSGSGFEALRWGRSKWALPSGKSIAWGPRPSDVSLDVVNHCGRGNVANATRNILSASTGPSDLRNAIIRLAYEKPELRETLLPLVVEGKTAAVGRTKITGELSVRSDGSLQIDIDSLAGLDLGGTYQGTGSVASQIAAEIAHAVNGSKKIGAWPTGPRGKLTLVIHS